MTVEIAIVLVVLAFMFVALYMDLFQPALVFLIAVMVFRLSGIINTRELLHGFSNENIIVIFLLLTISEIVKKTAVVDNSVSKLLNQNLKYPWFLARMSTTVALFSAFVNNTPLVAFLMPYAQDWAKKNNMSPSRVLLPLSYAAIIGGTLTLVGTSTHLLVNGLYMEEGYPSLGLFDFLPVALPSAILGILLIYLLISKILPERKSILSDFEEQTREYLVETIVPPMSKFINKTIEQARLRNLKGLYLVQIIRDDKLIAPVSPKEVIQRKDRLFFAGDTDKILDLVEGNKNLILPFGRKMLADTSKNIVEVIVTNNSRLHNNTAKAFNFRQKYDAAIIAIQRNGEKLKGKIGEIILKSGDLLLLVTGEKFADYAKTEDDFFVLSRVKHTEPIPAWKKWVFFLSLLAAFALMVLEVIPLFIGLTAVLGVAALIEIVKFNELKKTVDLNLFLILGMSLALGKAFFNSGLAELLATRINLMLHYNPAWVLAILFLLTNLISVFIGNKAAVAITFPIALAAAKLMNITNPEPLVLAVALGGSASFISPFSFQTNLMVLGPGGYKFSDYVKAGFPLMLIYLIVTVFVLKYLYALG